jgi:hypothetical protein
MADINSLLKEAQELGILNIEVDSSRLTAEILEIAIQATKDLNLELDDNDIANKIQEVKNIERSA